VFIGPKKL
ncbi:hypothetical protein ECEC1870_1795, partial [Escherichia coli EC1870]